MTRMPACAPCSARTARSIVRLFPFALICWAPAAFAQPGAEASGHAQAEVVVPIRVIPLARLSFGSVVVAPSGESAVELDPDGSPARYRNAAQSNCSGQTDCAPHLASFEVTGEANRSYRINLPEGVTAYGLRTGVGLPVVRLKMRSLNTPDSGLDGRLDNAGRDLFFVGGTLQLPAGTRPDVFRAELPVIVTYN